MVGILVSAFFLRRVYLLFDMGESFLTNSGYRYAFGIILTYSEEPVKEFRLHLPKLFWLLGEGGRIDFFSAV